MSPRERWLARGERMIGTRVVLAVVGAVFLAGCASAHYYTVKPVDAPGPCMTTVPERDLLLGVALSGGGSRAALFAEAGLEALAELRTADGKSVIDKIAHISSVSGGSLSASYYALKKPGRDVPVLNADGALSIPIGRSLISYGTRPGRTSRRPLFGASSWCFAGSNPPSPARTFSESP